MSTVQNYVLGGGIATHSGQTALTASESASRKDEWQINQSPTSFDPDNPDSKSATQTAKNQAQDYPLTYFETLTAVHEWATKTLLYIKHRNHLTPKEKRVAYELVAQHEYRLRTDLTCYKVDGEPPATDLNKLFTVQAKVNNIARYYEFPPYRLPDEIPLAKRPDYIAFEVIDDKYATILCKSDELICKSVDSLADLKARDLVVVTYRYNYRTPRQFHVGWFGRLKGNELVLTYERPRLVRKYPSWSISLHHVIHLYKAETISRNWE